jgi:hypothetical protein
LIDYFIGEDFDFIDSFLSGEHIPGMEIYFEGIIFRFLWTDARRKKRKRTRIGFKIFGRDLE